MTTPGPKVAFAGLGAMGLGMASQLLKSGFQVVGYDVYQPSMENFTAVGGECARSIEEAAKDAQFFICMVATSIQATPLLLDPETGAVGSLPQSATILICSTVAPAYIRELSQRLKTAGRSDLRLIDSPVSGGAGRAAMGTLSIFSSGADANLANAHAILECMSAKLYKIPGGLGGGSKAKLIHQIFAGIHIAMSSEAMGLAAVSGHNTREAFEYLSQSEGSSWMFTNRVPPMLEISSPYSSMTIIGKDVGIITSTSRSHKFPLPLLSTSEQLYMIALSAGWGKEDDCALVKVYLPGRPNLVLQQAGTFKTSQTSELTLNDIENLMVGVHLAAMSEAMAFCVNLCIDTNLMFDIVNNAAGASAVFSKYFHAMDRRQWSLNSIPNATQIRHNLVSETPRYQLFPLSPNSGEGDRQNLRVALSSVFVIRCIAGI